jgi:hypothetical protein
LKGLESNLLRGSTFGILTKPQWAFICIQNEPMKRCIHKTCFLLSVKPPF